MLAQIKDSIARRSNPNTIITGEPTQREGKS